MLSLIINCASLVISFVLPLLSTYRALESKRLKTLEPLVIYWLVFGIITVVESYFYFFLKYVPLYQFLRLYLSVWLISPQSKGSEYIYYNLIEPSLNRHLSTVESWIHEVNFERLYMILISLIKNNKLPDNTHETRHTYSYSQSFFERYFGETRVVSDQSILGISLWNSLVNAVQLFPQQGSINKGASGVNKNPDSDPSPVQVEGSNSETESNHSSGFDVVTPDDFDPIRNYGEKKASGSQGWFQNWWSKPEASPADNRKIQ